MRWRIKMRKTLIINQENRSFVYVGGDGDKRWGISNPAGSGCILWFYTYTETPPFDGDYYIYEESPAFVGGTWYHLNSDGQATRCRTPQKGALTKTPMWQAGWEQCAPEKETELLHFVADCMVGVTPRADETPYILRDYSLRLHTELTACRYQMYLEPTLAQDCVTVENELVNAIAEADDAIASIRKGGEPSAQLKARLKLFVEQGRIPKTAPRLGHRGVAKCW